MSERDLELVQGRMELRHAEPLQMGRTRPLQGVRGIATGELHWTRCSLCEHPYYPGLFLQYYQYYLTDGCGTELFLCGDLPSNAVRHPVWAEGTLVEEGFCRILDVSDLTVCASDAPAAAARD